MPRRVLLFALLGLCLVLLAAVGERYALRIDLTAQRVHSLSTAAQSALDALADPLEITAFVPDRPVERAQITRLLAPYLDHPAAPRLVFVDPVVEPQRASAAGVTRHGELQLHSGTRREVVARPAHASLDTALTRLALRGDRWIVVFRGHGESPLDDTPGGLGRLAGHLEQAGYRVIALDPRDTGELPDNAALVVAAGPRSPYSPRVLDQVERFVARGGALLWLIDTPAPVRFAGLQVDPLPGVVVDAAAAAHGLESPDHAVVGTYPQDLLPHPPAGQALLLQARGIDLVLAGDDWKVAGRLQSSPRSWNETGDLRGRVARDPELGEQAGPVTVAVAVEGPPSDGRTPRALFVGGRQFIVNDQLGQGDNLALALGLVNWLTANQQVSATAPAPDLEVDWSPQLGGTLGAILMGVLPVVYLAFGAWLRRRRRRA